MGSKGSLVFGFKLVITSKSKILRSLRMVSCPLRWGYDAWGRGRPQVLPKAIKQYHSPALATSGRHLGWMISHQVPESRTPSREKDRKPSPFNMLGKTPIITLLNQYLTPIIFQYLIPLLTGHLHRIMCINGGFTRKRITIYR